MNRTVRRLAAGLAIAAVLIAGPAATAVASAPVPAASAALIAAANPMAVEAGLEILRRGGDAADAAVAIQAMLGLVEPQSSGIGGGAFLMYYHRASGQVTAWNGRETAPMGASPTQFLDDAGKPLARPVAIHSGRATGVPGVMAMLAEVHRVHGRLPWNTLFDTTISAAEHGFAVTPRLADQIARHALSDLSPDARTLFARADGTPLQAGDLFINGDYARTLRRIADEGVGALYSGEIARQIVSRTRAAPYPGSMTEADLARYRPQQIPALCRPYRLWILCAPAPPASGVGLLELMGLLERTDIATRGPDDARAWFQFAQASRLMYADRDLYVGDPDFVDVPVEGLLDGGYLDARARLIGETAQSAPVAGRPARARSAGVDATLEPGGTTHFVIVDSAGNVVSMTTTVESYFGSGRVVGGFFLNNQLTDFSFLPVTPDGAPAANALAGGKRPRSSMTPVIILDRQGRWVGAVGSPGGNAIPAYVAKTLVGVLDWGLDIQAAIDLPNLVARGASFNGEAGKFRPGLLEELRALGVDVRPGSGEESGVHAVMLIDGQLQGGADSRREGQARRLTP